MLNGSAWVTETRAAPRAAHVSDRSGRAFGLAALAVIGLGVVFPHLPALEDLIFCPFRALVGLPCLTCGISRAAILIGAGHPIDALVLAPLPTLGLALAGLAGVLAISPRGPSPSDLARQLVGTRRRRLIALAIVLALWGYAIGRSILTGSP